MEDSCSSNDETYYSAREEQPNKNYVISDPISPVDKSLRTMMSEHRSRFNSRTPQVLPVGKNMDPKVLFSIEKRKRSELFNQNHWRQPSQNILAEGSDEGNDMCEETELSPKTDKNNQKVKNTNYGSISNVTKMNNPPRRRKPRRSMLGQNQVVLLSSESDSSSDSDNHKEWDGHCSTNRSKCCWNKHIMNLPPILSKHTVPPKLSSIHKQNEFEVGPLPNSRESTDPRNLMSSSRFEKVENWVVTSPFNGKQTNPASTSPLKGKRIVFSSSDLSDTSPSPPYRHGSYFTSNGQSNDRDCPNISCATSKHFAPAQSTQYTCENAEHFPMAEQSNFDMASRNVKPFNEQECVNDSFEDRDTSKNGRLSNVTVTSNLIALGNILEGNEPNSCELTCNKSSDRIFQGNCDAGSVEKENSILLNATTSMSKNSSLLHTECRTARTPDLKEPLSSPYQQNNVSTSEDSANLVTPTRTSIGLQVSLDSNEEGEGDDLHVNITSEHRHSVEREGCSVVMKDCQVQTESISSISDEADAGQTTSDHEHTPSDATNISYSLPGANGDIISPVSRLTQDLMLRLSMTETQQTTTDSSLKEDSTSLWNKSPTPKSSNKTLNKKHAKNIFGNYIHLSDSDDSSKNASNGFFHNELTEQNDLDLRVHQGIRGISVVHVSDSSDDFVERPSKNATDQKSMANNNEKTNKDTSNKKSNAKYRIKISQLGSSIEQKKSGSENDPENQGCGRQKENRLHNVNESGDQAVKTNLPGNDPLSPCPVDDGSYIYAPPYPDHLTTINTTVGEKIDAIYGGKNDPQKYIQSPHTGSKPFQHRRGLQILRENQNTSPVTPSPSPASIKPSIFLLECANLEQYQKTIDGCGTFLASLSLIASDER